MSEARNVEEAAHSIGLALYELQRQPNWNGGATRAEITRYCLAQKLPTPERYFDAAIEQVDADKTTTDGYHPGMADVRYALTREGRQEVEGERRAPHLSDLDELAASPVVTAQSRTNWPRVTSLPIAETTSFAPERDPVERAPSFADALARWHTFPEAVKLIAAFGLGTITGMVLANLR